MYKKIFVLASILILLVGNTAFAVDKPADPATGLKEAAALKRTSFKQEKSVKETILLETVARYQALIRAFPEAFEACAEASFRAAEILRSLKKTDEALAGFEQTVKFHRTGLFAARALKEIGHIHRRLKDYDKALNYYDRVLAKCAAHPEVCADAMTWIGKVHLKQKEYAAARSVFMDFAERFAQFPEEVIRNIDLAAGSYLEEGARDKAEGMLKEWQQRFEASLGEDPKRDVKIEKALERMKTPEKLKEG